MPPKVYESSLFSGGTLTPLWDDLLVQAVRAEHEFTRANYNGQLVLLLGGCYNTDLVVDKTELGPSTALRQPKGPLSCPN